MSLEVVCRECADPNTRADSVDIKLGRKFNLQSATRVNLAADAIRDLRGDPFVIETKFDGWRITAHCANGSAPNSIKYYTRSNKYDQDAGAKFGWNCMDPALQQQIDCQDAIFDGELLVWNKSKGCFAAFSSINPTKTAVLEKVGPTELITFTSGARDQDGEVTTTAYTVDLEIVYIVFDIVYYNGKSCVHLPLSQRHDLLRKALKPAPLAGIALSDTAVTARVVTILPDSTAALHPGFPPSIKWSRSGDTVQDIQNAFDRVEVDDMEGVVIKNMNAKYNFGRSSGWIKWKPDYGKTWELDCLIVGGWRGTGKRAGGIAQYLLAIANDAADSRNTSFISFCKVGTGATDEEREHISEQLGPYLREALLDGKRDTTTTPKWLKINPLSTSEWPNVWVTRPEKSFVLEITADMRSISGWEFGKSAALRHPRIVRVRHDKGHNQCTTLHEMQDMLRNQSSVVKPQTLTQVATRKAAIRKPTQSKVMSSAKATGATRDFVGDFLHGRYVNILRNTWVNQEERARLEACIQALGGKVTQNIVKKRVPSDLIVTGSGPAHKVKAAIATCVHTHAEADIIRGDWLHRCCEDEALVNVAVQDYAHVSDSTLLSMIGQPGRDAYGVDLEPSRLWSQDEVKALLNTMVPRAVQVLGKKREVDLLSAKNASDRHAVELQSSKDLPPEPTQMQLQETAGSLANLTGRSVNVKDCVDLVGCCFAILALPEVNRASAAYNCEHRLWTAVANKRGGRVIPLNESESSHALHDLTHIVLLPSTSAALLKTVTCSPPRNTTQTADTIATHLRIGMPLWTPLSLVTSLRVDAPHGAQALGAGLSQGTIQLVSASWLTHQSISDLSDSSLPMPDNSQNREWVATLPWDQVGVDPDLFNPRTATKAKSSRKRRIVTDDSKAHTAKKSRTRGSAAEREVASPIAKRFSRKQGKAKLAPAVPNAESGDCVFDDIPSAGTSSGRTHRGSKRRLVIDSDDNIDASPEHARHEPRSAVPGPVASVSVSLADAVVEPDEPVPASVQTTGVTTAKVALPSVATQSAPIVHVPLNASKAGGGAGTLMGDIAAALADTSDDD